jgi:hypothetical protein
MKLTHIEGGERKWTNEGILLLTLKKAAPVLRDGLREVGFKSGDDVEFLKGDVRVKVLRDDFIFLQVGSETTILKSPLDIWVEIRLLWERSGL